MLKISGILDPRGKQERPQLIMAPRVTLKKLQEGPLVFYNNTKLEFCNYTEIFPRIKELFQLRGISNFIDFPETVRGKTTADLKPHLQKESHDLPRSTYILDMGSF
jgi:hypothetical protein